MKGTANCYGSTNTSARTRLAIRLALGFHHSPAGVNSIHWERRETYSAWMRKQEESFGLAISRKTSIFQLPCGVSRAIHCWMEIDLFVWSAARGLRWWLLIKITAQRFGER